jgi:undecaprenyl diphosphate synthase
MQDISALKIPAHVSLIMDGNGRWAKKRHMPRTYGHSVGADNVMNIVEDADAIGIKYLTVYAFSTENWNRPENEVKTLMRLFRKYLKICYRRAMANNTRVRIIGDKSGFDRDLQDIIRVLETDTASHDGMQFQIAMNYGSRDEMLRAMKKILTDQTAGKISPEDLTEEKFASYLDTAGIPDPDLMIRTSGEQRLSNWMMWQHAYSEFVFTDVAWPDFHKEELIRCIEEYTRRDRRFGGISE